VSAPTVSENIQSFGFLTGIPEIILRTSWKVGRQVRKILGQTGHDEQSSGSIPM
jgi:hypothetical protein